MPSPPVSRADRLRRLAYRAAHRVLRVWWFVRRPQTRGVKLILRNAGEMVFVRHAYGDRAGWEIPGGGIGRGETAEQAGTREAREELGLHIERWTNLGEVVVTHRATATLTCLVADLGDRRLAPDFGELEEVRWSAMTAPPQPEGRDAMAVLDLARARAAQI